MSSIPPARRLASPPVLRERRAIAARSEFLHGLVALWQAKCRDDRLPARRDFPMAELRPWIGTLALVDVAGEPPRFHWRLVGTEIVDQLGRDVTGKTFEEVYDGDWLARMVATFSKAVRRRSPVYFHGTLRFVDKDYRTFSLVHLPLASDGTTVDMLMVCLDFS